MILIKVQPVIPEVWFFFSLFLWSDWTWQQYWWTFFSVRPQESVQRSQLPRLTAWPLIKTVENEITPQIHHGRRWLSESLGAATHRMFTPGPLGLSALRVFLESRPDFSNGPRGFFSLHPPFALLQTSLLSHPSFKCSWWGWQRLGVAGHPPSIPSIPSIPSSHISHPLCLVSPSFIRP